MKISEDVSERFTPEIRVVTGEWIFGSRRARCPTRLRLTVTGRSNAAGAYPKAKSILWTAPTLWHFLRLPDCTLRGACRLQLTASAPGENWGERGPVTGGQGPTTPSWSPAEPSGQAVGIVILGVRAVMSSPTLTTPDGPRWSRSVSVTKRIAKPTQIPNSGLCQQAISGRVDNQCHRASFHDKSLPGLGRRRLRGTREAAMHAATENSDLILYWKIAPASKIAPTLPTKISGHPVTSTI